MLSPTDAHTREASELLCTVCENHKRNIKFDVFRIDSRDCAGIHSLFMVLSAAVGVVMSVGAPSRTIVDGEYLPPLGKGRGFILIVHTTHGVAYKRLIMPRYYSRHSAEAAAVLRFLFFNTFFAFLSLFFFSAIESPCLWARRSSNLGR